MSRRSRIAPARTSAGADTTRPVGRTKPSHSRCARISGSSLAMAFSSSPARGRRARPARCALRAPRRTRGCAAARCLRSRSNCSRRMRHERMSDSSCRFSSSPKSKVSCLKSRLMLGELFAHALALPLEDLAQILLFALAALLELLDRQARPVPRRAARAGAGVPRCRAARRLSSFCWIVSPGVRRPRLAPASARGARASSPLPPARRPRASRCAGTARSSAP